MTLHRPKMRFSPFLLFFLVLFALIMQGCFHSSSGGNKIGVTPDVDPTGYYDVSGTANVGDVSSGMLTITDLQGLVNGTRFIAISDANGLVYDGTITEINTDDFTATVSVFQDGTLITTAPVTGMITAGAKITGTLTGSGLGSGSFELIYALSNDQAADLSRLQLDVLDQWITQVGGSTNLVSALGFVVGTTGNITHISTPIDGIFNGCNIDSGTILPVVGTSLYTASMTLSNCNNTLVDGDYEGLAITRTESTETPVGDRLVLVTSNSDFGLYGEFIISGQF